jgi:hypothetical protein
VRVIQRKAGLGVRIEKELDIVELNKPLFTDRNSQATKRIG